MSLPPTAAQRAVIASTRHLLVDAGAGTGKTSTVVQAICHQLGVAVPHGAGSAPIAPVAVPLTIDQVAAVTFTNAAAADLKRKLRLALRAAGRPALAQDVDAARIGTIHGFCADLLREFALRGGRRPAQRLLAEGEASALLADCAREALHGAIEHGDLPDLDALLMGRRLRDITEWVACLAQDAGRLERWHELAGAHGLRGHEVALLALARRATMRRLDRLRDEGLTDFDHLLGEARALLRDDAVRHAVQRRLRLLVVDEFQDVDPVQRDIAELLGGLAHGDAQPTRLVLVGDPKQSIYRFRRADVTLWKETEAHFRAGAGDVLPLDENFRSRAAILGFVDAVIGATMDAPVDAAAGTQPFEVAYHPLRATPPRIEGDRAVELLVVPAVADGKTATAGVVRERDAAGTARRILELRREGTHAFGDIAILLAAWGDVETYERALREAGIPAYVLRGEGFWEAREVIDCLLALRAIRDPADHVAMTGFLKGPFVGLRDDSLLALAQARGVGTYAEAMARALDEDAFAERDLLRRATALLARFGALRDRIPLAALVDRLLLESGYLAEAALDRDGAQRCANLRKLVRLAGDSPGRSLGEFLREAQEARARGEKVAPEPLYRERGDVVTITSVHGAKGLEWPVVFWCDLVREVRAETGRLCLGRETFALATVDESGDTGGADADPRHAALKASLSQEGLAEAYRLWYVAATRAKDLLVLGGLPLGTPRTKATTPARRVLERLGVAGAGTIAYRAADGRGFQATVREAEPAGLTAPAPVVEPALAIAPPALPAPAGPARLSATRLMAAAERATATAASRTRRDAPAPAIVTGQVVHDILERLLEGSLALDDLLEASIAARDDDAPAAETDAGVAYRAAIRARVGAALASGTWRAVAGAPGARRELAFTRLLPDGSAIVGALDLAAPAADGAPARIVDVKTGVASGDDAARRYRLQAETYVDAVRAIAGTDARFVLLSLPSGEVTPIDVAPAAAAGDGPGGALREAIARLRER